MVSSPHEAQHRIFQENPTLFTSAFRALGVPFPEPVAVSLMDTDLTELRPIERHVDTLLRIDVVGGSCYLLAIEAQGRKDPEKRSSWAYYLAHLYAKFRYPPVLLVVCRDKGTAEWAAEPIRIGLEKHPSLAVFPLVLGPHNVPAVTDAARAAEDIPMAVFSAITHGNDQDIAAILEALAVALRTTDADAAAVFAEFTEAGLGDTPARKIWRDLMSTSLSHFHGIVAESFRKEGRQEGREEGREEGVAKERALSVLRVLDHRGVAVDEAVRERIGSCRDLRVLDVWVDRAFTVKTTDELFA
ncbi:hypothetical protein AB0E67_29270 [Streptomyces sp. NPDC032161]|uniref:hypothetical protein n=1 Tax=unclassified Streptomyces TaxID=2593676 RepID=UPI0033C139DC